MSKFKGTKGEWEVVDNYDNDSKIYVGTDNQEGNEVYNIETDEMNYMQDFANAQLIADAGNTIQKCDLLPSELLEQRDELLKTLIKAELEIVKLKHHYRDSGHAEKFLRETN